MNQEITFDGFTAVPSDYECPDGTLAASINLLPEDGSLHPLFPPRILHTPGPDTRVHLIHQGTGYRHYIATLTVRDTGTDALRRLYYFTDDDPSPRLITGFLPGAQLHAVRAVGNTLIALTSESMFYFLWRPDEGAYVTLGTHLPELHLSFGLQGELVCTDPSNVTFSGMSSEQAYKSGITGDDNRRTITNQVLGQVNKFLADEVTGKGRFVFPFLVRYAYRLYDGSLTMHSAPVLMLPSSAYTGLGEEGKDDGTGVYAVWRQTADSQARVRVFAECCALDCALLGASQLRELSAWSDIISSVDIFISAPIYTYDQNGECRRFGSRAHDRACCRHTAPSTDGLDTTHYAWHDISKLYTAVYGRTEEWTPGPIPIAGSGTFISFVSLPARPRDAVWDDIRSCAAFYHLHSFKPGELPTERTLIPVSKDYLQSLVARERMTDDYDSHDRLIPCIAFTYNSRLNLAGISKQVYSYLHPAALASWADPQDAQQRVSVYIFLRKGGREVVIRSLSAAMLFTTGINYVYHPDRDAYRALVVYSDSAGTVTSRLELPLTPHAFLNGACWVGGGGEGINRSTDIPVPEPTPASRLRVDYPAKLYTSEVNNPFHFPATGINTVGTGTILGVSTAAKALSEGQFGQFPLYAFTTEGVWALEVGTTGTYTARQPITRDVCINPAGITQLDSAVLFPTARGIMLLSGSQAQCISEPLNSDYPFDVLTLPGADRLHTLLGHDPQTDSCLPTLPFTRFLSRCRIAYDYHRQRIIVYAPGVTYAYVFSLRSRQWGMTFTSLTSHLESYPEAIASDAEGNLVDLSTTGATSTRCLAVTRPLKLGAPDVFKTVDDIILRGHFRTGDVQTVLYASRDLYHWHPVWSSVDHRLHGFSGTPYKYFRIAFLATLTPDESVRGASVRFQPRRTNRPR